MPRMNRRRMIIYLGTLAFGASGLVASGAFTTSSQGSLGDNWIQVDGTDQPVSFGSPQQIDVGDGSDGDGGNEDGTDRDDEATGESTDDGEGQPDDGSDDESADNTEEDDQQDDGSDESSDNDRSDGDDESETGTTRVQVVTDPNNPGNVVNNGSESSATWNGTVIPDSKVLGTDGGFLRGIAAENVSRNATSKIGRLQNGYPNGEVAFIIANVGPEEAGGSTGAVSVTATLFADDAVFETNQLRFPYRVVNSGGTTVTRGKNLFSAGSVTLADGHIIEVVVVIDTHSDTDELERIDNLRFTATGVGN